MDVLGLPAREDEEGLECATEVHLVQELLDPPFLALELPSQELESESARPLKF